MPTDTPTPIPSITAVQQAYLDRADTATMILAAGLLAICFFLAILTVRSFR